MNVRSGRFWSSTFAYFVDDRELVFAAPHRPRRVRSGRRRDGLPERVPLTWHDGRVPAYRLVDKNGCPLKYRWHNGCWLDRHNRPVSRWRARRLDQRCRRILALVARDWPPPDPGGELGGVREPRRPGGSPLPSGRAEAEQPILSLPDCSFASVCTSAKSDRTWPSAVRRY